MHKRITQVIICRRSQSRIRQRAASAVSTGLFPKRAIAASYTSAILWPSPSPQQVECLCRCEAMQMKLCRDLHRDQDQQPPPDADHPDRRD